MQKKTEKNKAIRSAGQKGKQGTAVKAGGAGSQAAKQDELLPEQPERLDDPGIVVGASEVEDRLRQAITYVLLLIFVCATGATYWLIFLWGFKKIQLPEVFIHWLGAATVGQTASLLIIIVKSLFPESSSLIQRRRKNRQNNHTE